MESKLIEEIEAILKPEYMNTVFTWKQIKDALESLSKPLHANRVSEEEIKKEAEKLYPNTSIYKEHGQAGYVHGMTIMQDRLSQLPTEGEDDDEFVEKHLKNIKRIQEECKTIDSLKDIQAEIIESIKPPKWNGKECKKGCNCIEIAEAENYGDPVKNYECKGGIPHPPVKEEKEE